MVSEETERRSERKVALDHSSVFSVKKEDLSDTVVKSEIDPAPLFSVKYEVSL